MKEPTVVENPDNADEYIVEEFDTRTKNIAGTTVDVDVTYTYSANKELYKLHVQDELVKVQADIARSTKQVQKAEGELVAVKSKRDKLTDKK